MYFPKYLDIAKKFLYYFLMERFNDFENCIEMENEILENLSLLEIAKCYCEANFDKSNEFGTLVFLLDIVLKKQRAIFNQLVD